MNLIDSLHQQRDQQEFMHNFLHKNTHKTQNQQTGPHFKITEINISPAKIVLPSFTDDAFYPQDLFKKRFLKIIKATGVIYRVFATFDMTKNQLFIQASPLAQSLIRFKASDFISLHLILLFSQLNPASCTQSFRVHPGSLEITISSGLLSFSKDIDHRKIDNIVNEMIDSFQHNYAQIHMYVHQKKFLNNPSVILCEPALKCVTIVSQILSNSCSTLDQLAVTTNEKEFYEQQQSQENKQIDTMKLPDKISKILGISKPKENLKINKNDLTKLLAPAKEPGDKSLNYLSLEIKIKEHNKLKWVNFASNQNNRIEVADAYVIFQNHSGAHLRSIVNKKPKTQNGIRQLDNTKKIYQTLRQKSCVNILKSYVSKQNSDEESIFTDYCRYGSLTNYIKKNKKTLSLKTKLYFLLQIATAIQFLHSQHIIHMDIKPSNFLVATNLWVKLTDFGQAIFNGDQRAKGWTSPYVAPEILQKKKIDYSADIYSFGVLVYQVITGKLLFPRRTETMQKFGSTHEFSNPEIKVHPQSLYFYGPNEIMMNLYALIMQCVSPIKKERPSTDKIILVLKSLIGLMQYLLISNSE